MALRVLLQPVGWVEDFVVDYVRRGLEEALSLTVHVSSVAMSPSLKYFDWSRAQYRADGVLDWLVGELGGLGYDRLLGLCGFDAYAGGLNFVFGLADPSRRAALVFTPRLRAGASHELYELRALKECLHELGHTFYLFHCPNRRCVMSFSNSVLEVDAKMPAYCAECARRLERSGLRVRAVLER